MVLTGISPEAAPLAVNHISPSGPAGMQALNKPARTRANLPSLPEQECVQDSRSDVSISDTSAGRLPSNICSHEPAICLVLQGL